MVAMWEYCGWSLHNKRYLKVSFNNFPMSIDNKPINISSFAQFKFYIRGKFNFTFPRDNWYFSQSRHFTISLPLEDKDIYFCDFIYIFYLILSISLSLEIELQINVSLQSFSISYISLSFFFFPLQGNLSSLIFGNHNFLNQGKYLNAECYEIHYWYRYWTTDKHMLLVNLGRFPIKLSCQPTQIYR